MVEHQFCAKLVSGCEVAVHYMSQIFDESEAALLADATNNFNTLSIMCLLYLMSKLFVPLLHLLLLILVIDLQHHYSTMARSLSLSKEPQKGIPLEW